MISLLSQDNNLMDQQKLSLLNYYLFEILKSKGIQSPSQLDINVTECEIKRLTVKLSAQSLKFSFYPKLQHSYGRILLVEDQPFYAAAHTMLLNNLNFDVDHVWHQFVTMRESILANYEAIFVSDHRPQIQANLIVRYLNQVRKYQLPKLIIITDKEKIAPLWKNEFNKEVVATILPRPLSFNILLNVMHELGSLKIN